MEKSQCTAALLAKRNSFSVTHLMSNSSDSGKGRNCSGPRLFRSRDLERPRVLVGLVGGSGSIARDDKS